MTEAGWLDCHDPMQMLIHLKAVPNSRKVLLLTLACIKRVERLLPETVKQWARVLEGVAEGAVDSARLDDDWEDVEMFFALEDDRGQCYAVINIAANCWQEWDRYEAGNAAWKTERRKHASYIREVFGNPFRPATVNPAWLTSTVVSLAQAIYAERAFDRLPILADALEDAGCDNVDILNHCRQPGVHVRGCWCVDSLLGKE